MGSISSGVGLISGINSAQLIEQLISLEGRGKITLQNKISTLTAQRTALLDVNARLLNFKNAASRFRTDKVFQTSTAKSSDDTVLTALAGVDTPGGSYQFFVKRLASTSQVRTKGFATSDGTPLGLDQLKFAFGDIGVSRSIDLASLNGGDGVRRGKIVITDKEGEKSTIDLSSTTTLEEVVAAINEDDNVGVTARIDGERLVIEDTTLGAGSLKITNAAGSNAASDLGIVQTTAGTSITSTQIHRLGALTTLASLNDGLGVLIRDGSTDFKLDVGGVVTNISLGREDLPITGATELTSLNNGSGVKINTTDAADFIVRTSTGVQVAVNLGTTLNPDGSIDDAAVKTVQEMLTRVNETLADELGAGNVVMSLKADGKGFDVTDTMGGADPLRVWGTGPLGDGTAKDLGIYTGSTASGTNVITGLTVKNQVAKPRAATIQDVIDRIAEQTTANGTTVTASINSAGTGIDLYAGGATITVLAGAVDGSSFGAALGEQTARDLGIFQPAGTTVSGSRVLAGAGTVLSRNINGGDGLAAASSLTLVDRAGGIVTVNNLESYTTLEDMIDAINTAAASNDVDLTVSVGSNNASLEITDTSNGPGALSVSGSAAAALGLDGTPTANGGLKGKDLGIQYISSGQSAGSLNYGRGIGTGSFKLFDSSGDSATVDIAKDTTTLYDVMQEINSRGLLIEARLNDAGDGLVLVDTNTGVAQSKMKVTSVSGTVAAGLGILGEAEAAGDDISGSYDKVVKLATTDSLKAVVAKIKAAGIPVTGSLVNTGSGGAPFALTFGSTIAGKSGRLTVDTGAIDLGLTTMSEGHDAEILFGNGDPAQAFALRSSTNTFDEIVTGLDVTVSKVSTSAVSVDVARDIEGIKTKVTDFVTTFNDAMSRIKDYDKYDNETKKRGALLGDSTLARTRQVMYSIVQGKAKNVSGSYQYLSQVGIKVGKNGSLDFDQAKFDTAYAADPEGVEKLFVTFEQQTVAAASEIPGVTVGTSTLVSTALGFGDLFDQAMKTLTNTVDGAFTKASQNFESQITRANERIETYDQRLDRRRTFLTKQFQAMEVALSKLQTQQSSLGAIQYIGI